MVASTLHGGKGSVASGKSGFDGNRWQERRERELDHSRHRRRRRRRCVTIQSASLFRSILVWFARLRASHHTLLHESEQQPKVKETEELSFELMKADKAEEARRARRDWLRLMKVSPGIWAKIEVCSLGCVNVSVVLGLGVPSS